MASRIGRQHQIACLPDLSFPEKYEEEDTSQPQPSPKRARVNSAEEESPCQCNRTDPDELFLLSCAPSLKRLNSKQNAVARLKIQQVLYEAEFGIQMELPYITPTGECGFDNNIIEESSQDASTRVVLCDQDRWKRAIVLQIPPTE
ncbi:BESS motif domain-containing protein [Phthorimaea operculella]|nr:BESS motif domain-containing protein [Phthorimaea operculella]